MRTIRVHNLHRNKLGDSKYKVISKKSGATYIVFSNNCITLLTRCGYTLLAMI